MDPFSRISFLVVTLFRLAVTLTFDLVTHKVDRFMPLPRAPIV